MCNGFELCKHIVDDSDDATSSAYLPPSMEWLKIDYIVLSWIFMILSNTLQERLVVADPETAQKAWDHIATIFYENKRTRMVALKGELRTLKLGFKHQR